LPYGSIKDSVVIVTGASSGIGRAIAFRLACAGARVACCGRNKEKLEKTRAELPGADHVSYLFDDNDPAGVEAMAARAAKEMGALGGVVHSAGMPSVQLLRDLNYDLAQAVMRINCLAFMALAKGACRKGRYVQSKMSVVGISSLAAMAPDQGQSSYAASKAALGAVIASLAKEYAPRGIRFNAICPSYVDTPMNNALKTAIGEEAFAERIKNRMPLGMIEPDDVADTALFLLSEKSRKITGASIVINGGDL
jgi:NAD(P)-dependent dehydrogenase (short-subunit alcohol dehydrogenase family)